MQSNNFKTTISIEDVFSLFTSKNQEFKSMELNALLKLYVKMQESKVRSDTIDMYLDHLGDMINFFNAHGVYETKHINQDIIDKYIWYSQVVAKNKNITINKRIGILTAMLKRTAEADLITQPVYKFQKLKESTVKIETIKPEDVKKILAQIDSMKLEHQVIIYLLLSTGIRRNELVNIKMQNINFRNKSIYLEFTKSGKPRYCYFGEKLEILLELLVSKNDPTNPYLFQHHESHIDKMTVSSMLYKLKKDLDIDILSAHKFRHLYATELLKNGADIFTVKELMGHQRLEITQRYLDFTNEELKQNNFKYNPLKNFE
ncbi:MAG: site-specific integrase [Roseburia sp.]|nr:site-specific integrase [Anaeroplasma bactoclasticum]MCM1196705.1 site-specific integrase [Roseburia sp.]MCM1557735.1 site-specific integrase [Anaeroplasma bactoclasticum]